MSEVEQSTQQSSFDSHEAVSMRWSEDEEIESWWYQSWFDLMTSRQTTRSLWSRSWLVIVGLWRCCRLTLRLRMDVMVSDEGGWLKFEKLIGLIFIHLTESLISITTYTQTLIDVYLQFGMCLEEEIKTKGGLNLQALNQLHLQLNLKGSYTHTQATTSLPSPPIKAQAEDGSEGSEEEGQGTNWSLDLILFPNSISPPSLTNIIIWFGFNSIVSRNGFFYPRISLHTFLSMVCFVLLHHSSSSSSIESRWL